MELFSVSREISHGGVSDVEPNSTALPPAAPGRTILSQ
jgi:hypothetical protein